MSVVDPGNDVLFKQDQLSVWLERNLSQAIAFHQGGRIDAAEKIYRKILQKVPNQPNANHNLGLIALDGNHVDVSLSFFRAALEAAPEEPQYWISYIEGLIKAGQYDDARLVISYGVDSGLQTEQVAHFKVTLDELTSESTQAESLGVARKVKKNSGVGSSPSVVKLNELALAFNKGDFERSELLAVELTQAYPKHGVAWKVLGGIYERQGLSEKAFDALKNAAIFLPQDDEAQYNLGNYFYDNGQLDDALKCYKRAIKLNSNFFKAHYNLGNVYKKLENLKKASASYIKALALDKNNISTLTNLAQVLYEQDKYTEARKYYEKVLKIQPDFIPAMVGMGAVCKSLEQFEGAESWFKNALAIKEDADAYHNLGDLYRVRGGGEEAEKSYKAAILLNPNSVDAYAKLGVLLRSVGRVRESIFYLDQAVNIDPLRNDIHIDLGLAKVDLGAFLEAEACYRKALEIDPDYWVTYNNLGLALYSMGRFSESEAAFDKAIELNSNQALIYCNQSLPVTAQGRIKEAEVYLKNAIELSPLYVNAYINLCTNYLAQGRVQDAELACIEALRLQPSSAKARSNLLFTMNYSGDRSADYRLEQARQFDEMILDAVKEPFTYWNCSCNSERLRIGLVSGDFRQHPVAYFLENWAKYVDFSKLELVAYSTDSREDEATGRLKPNFSEWKSLVGLSDKAAAKLIHDDALHILIDLSGHTSGNRLPIFAWKPAPVQVSWIGYFATTGMKSIDYFIADTVGVPEINRSQFVEKIKYVPDTRLCFTAPSNAIEVSTLPALKNGFITFASFQTMVKAGDEVLELWAEVLRALPQAKFRWQCKSFSDHSVLSDLMEKFSKLGIDSSRLTLLGAVSREAYLAVHSEVDVILDTFPYPGGTTTCEALWMGVPTLTLMGNTLISRQGASLLCAAGLSDWVAIDKADYVNKALLLCSDLNQLASLRFGLRDRVLESPLFNALQFSKNIEELLFEMWQEFMSTNARHRLVNEGVMPTLNCRVQLISATKFSEADFWTKSALGVSLRRHLKQDARIKVSIAFDNLRGLPEVFNEEIERCVDDDVLIFIHDDVWIDEANLVDAVVAGLEHYDVIGVAGNRRIIPNQPSWAFINDQFIKDDKSNLSGSLAFGVNAFAEVQNFGEMPVLCELLDGVFFAVKASTLKRSQVRFDKRFDFYFHDMDFCRMLRSFGLSLGTWPIRLTHQTFSEIGSNEWIKNYRIYLNKWEYAEANLGKLDDAIGDVLQLAIEHQEAGDLEQAKILYQEILNIQPHHIEASRNLDAIALVVKGS